MSNVTDILKQLDNFNYQSGIDVYIPSLKRTIKFKAINLRQQKNLLKSSVEESLTRTSFITNFFSIIQENVLEGININDLYVFDRNAIAIALRGSSLDSKYTINDVEYDLNDKIKEIPSFVVDDSILTETITMNKLKVVLEVPKLGIDRDVSIAVLNKIKKEQKDSIDSLVGELFIHEILKFVQSVTFMSETSDNTVLLGDTKVEERLSIIERFPAPLTTQILTFIKKYRDKESELVKIGDSVIDINSSFFMI